MSLSLEARFEKYCDRIVAALMHADREQPARWYIKGLMLPGGRKSVEPMAARVEPQQVRSAHQSMHHLVAEAPWSDEALLSAVAESVLPKLMGEGAAVHWIIDDTGLPKKGKHSVGVAHQYCGQTGKPDSCRVAVSLSIATAHGSLPVGWGEHQPRPAPEPRRRVGRPRQRLQRDTHHPPISVAEVARALPARQWRSVTWRQGVAGALKSRFARVRVRAAHRDQPRDEEWLIIEWPHGAEEPAHYGFSNLPKNTPRQPLIDTVMGRWRIEREYEELKQELGLGHYEGRNWRGFHHHASLCIAAYGFLMLERLAGSKKKPARFKTSALPPGFRPRGAGTHAPS